MIIQISGRRGKGRRWEVKKNDGEKEKIGQKDEREEGKDREKNKEKKVEGKRRESRA